MTLGPSLFFWLPDPRPLAFIRTANTPNGFIENGRLFLVFRGTEEIADIKSDFRYVKTDFPDGGRVHEGFLGAFREVADAIGNDLKDHTGKTWIFTGHSLGAALALLAAAAYLYGCPRVGNKAFVDRIQCPVRRFENRADVVTKLPPPTSPLQAWHSLTHGRLPSLYRHAGKQVSFAGFGHRARTYEAATVGVRMN